MPALNLTGTGETEAFRELLRTGLNQPRFNIDATVLVLSEACSQSPVPLPPGPVWVLRLYDGETPPCLASFRVRDSADPSAAVAWLAQVLDWSPLTSSENRAYWSKRLALASMDLERAATAIVPFGSSLAVAVAPDVVVGAFDSPAPAHEAAKLLRDFGSVAVYQTAAPLPAFLSIANETPTDPALAAIGLKISEPRPEGAVLSKWDSPPGLSFSPGLLGAAANGNVLVSLATGALLGLQTESGKLIPASVLRDLLAPFLPPRIDTAPEDYFEKVSPEDYTDRKGYLPNFLGTPVPLPTTSKQIKHLPYENFTVAIHPPRKVAMFTAVNIDGRRIVDTTRTTDPWKLDPRLDAGEQIGKHYYEGTPFDRGHMVRRLDPVWGDASKKAELDTFHYPNSCPQHKDLNRKTWNDLEDYLYDNLHRDDMKVTVFTGPVLSSSDPLYHEVQLPQEFWKVAVIMTDQGQLSATGYILSQEEMIKGLEFVFGEFRTYQVPIKLIEKKTGLDFGDLRKFDPKTKSAGLEAVPLEVKSAQDLDLTPPPPVAAAWSDPVDAENKLKAALNTFDWKTADALTTGLIDRLRHDPSGLVEINAKRVLSMLRRKRRFPPMTSVADAFLQAGVATPLVRRQYAQSLIDRGILSAAESVVRGIIADPSAPRSEQEEAQGLLGRVFKQTYVDAAAPANPRNGVHLQTALDAYSATYAMDAGLYWHGINVVAILARAKRDGIALQYPADYRQIAQDILKTLIAVESDPKTVELDAFGLATRLEAYLALDAIDDAAKAAKAYSDAPDADAFEIASTLRQLEEVWQLKDGTPAGDALLPFLRAGLLKRQGGSLQLSAAGLRLEKVFGTDKSQTLDWYLMGLQRAHSVARIEVDGKGVGTGWVVDPAQLVPGKPSRRLLVTNAHVIGPGAVHPEDATVHFQIQGVKIKGPKVAFQSPVSEFDATFLELESFPPDADPMPLDLTPIAVAQPDPQRLYIIGHPGGRDLEFSLQDNQLLAAAGRFVHYRTPSEGGSSGSPVFGPTGWKVIALHHAGRKDMPRLDGPGTYEANEGIALSALKVAVAASRLL